MYGMLASYKLHARTFGGRSDGNLVMRHENCETIQKWINLMSKMIDEYKNAGRFVTMDSAYMGDMKMKAGSYESTMWQHNIKPLLFVAWCDNSVVKTLSNCHGPVVLPAGMA